MALALALVAPTIASGVLFSSYLNLVRPVNGKALYASRSLQIVDAVVGIGGWNGFMPIAPSLQDNLRNLGNQAQKIEDKLKYESLAQEIPWTYFPIQTWTYLFLLAISLDSAVVGGAYLTGSSRFSGSVLFQILRKLSSKARKLRKQSRRH
jgi:hypothetical protein